MARILNAVRRYGPRVVLGRPVRSDELMEWIASRAGVRESQVALVLAEASEAVLHFSARGTPVQLPGIGSFEPVIRRDGRLRLVCRAAPVLRGALNDAGAYRGRIAHAARIGLDDAGYKALWDADYPHDPLEV